MIDRDYSMMITKQPEWTKIYDSTIDYQKCKKVKRKCKIIDTYTGTESIYEGLRDADRQNCFTLGTVTMAIKNKSLIGKRYRAEYA